MLICVAAATTHSCCPAGRCRSSRTAHRLSWAQYLCALKYGVNLIVLVEFADVPGSWNPDLPEELYYQTIYGCDTAAIDCDNQLETAMFPRNEVDPSLTWM